MKHGAAFKSVARDSKIYQGVLCMRILSDTHLQREAAVPGDDLANDAEDLGPVALLEGTVAQGLQGGVSQKI